MPQLTELLETAVGSIAPRFDVADVEARAVRFRRARRFRALVASAVVVVVLVGTLVSWNSSSSPRVSISPAGGTVLGVATNTVLMVDDYDGVVLVDLDRRVVVRRQWDGQAPGDYRYRLIRLGDSLVGVGLGGAGRVSGAYATPLDGKPSQLLDGEAWDYVPAAEPGRVWVLGRPGGTPGADSITAREVDVHGKVRLEHRIEPSQGVAMIGIPGGLALQAASGGINLFDASTGTITAHLGGHAPAFAHAVHAATHVWCDVCTTLHLTTIGGTDLPVAAPAGSTGFEPDATAFSPDGRYVAAISWEGPPYATGTTEDPVVID